MTRKENLIKALEGADLVLIQNVVDEVIFVEKQLQELKKLPLIKVNPENSLQQKATPAAKQYKEFLQQYNNLIKLLYSISGQKENDEESHLRKWVNKHVEKTNH